MNTQNTWGVVLLAGGFAVLAVGVAAATYTYENRAEKKPAIVAVSSAADSASAESDAARDWRETLERFSSGPADALSPTDTFGLKLSEIYQTTLGTELSDEEREAMFSRLIAENLPKPDAGVPVSLAELTIREEAALDVYRELTLIILRESAKVREYELVSFSRAVSEGSYTGIPELKEAAAIYKKIKNALVVMEVPSSVAREHLALVNSVGSLSTIVSAMSRWNGDPLLGLTYLDSFISTENALAQNIEELFIKIEKIS